MGPIEETKRKKIDVINILITTVLIALSVNLIVSSITNGFNKIIFFIGLLFLIISLCILIIIYFPFRKFHYVFKGGISYYTLRDKFYTSNIPHYDFSKDFVEYLKSYINTNPNKKKLFISPEKNYISENEQKKFLKELRNEVYQKYEPGKDDKISILNSIFEYIILKQLGSSNSNNPILTNTFYRKNFGLDVLKNKFLKSITFDLQDSSICFEKEDGIIKEKIQLKVPAKTKIYRNEDNFLTLKNNFFEIQINPKVYPHIASGLIFLKIDETTSFDMSAQLEINIKLSPFTFLFPNKLQYYSWIDNFLNKLEKYIDLEFYKTQLNITQIDYLFEKMKK